jgi:hypothetical protein
MWVFLKLPKNGLKTLHPHAKCISSLENAPFVVVVGSWCTQQHCWQKYVAVFNAFSAAIEIAALAFCSLFLFFVRAQPIVPKPNKRRRHSRRAHASKKRKERVMEESTRSRIWLLSRDQEPKWPFKDIGREDARSSSFLLFAPIFVERSSLWIELKAPLD